KSSAALRIAKNLNQGYPLLFGFMIIPTFIRNGVYDFIAANRYKWFGKKESCMLPTPELRSRFLD
ncbi:MAG: DCC1-like thiol-disulfide oxidoreductase family protein, partial [Bacteroidota bacterium]|nr:DCC1-like thiol-disulfide oxidoreductase family protein [Bacteroidota bacterium]